MLLGRSNEYRRLEALVGEARAGNGGTFVIRGEPGIGKSELLEYVAGHSSGCRVERARGVESEMEIPFVGLHQLCAPMVQDIHHLPAPQRDALDAAFGGSSGSSSNRLMIGLGTLSLLSETARKAPLICLVDDAHWLDHASLDALAFAGRRLVAEPVLLVFAVREADKPELRGLPELVVTGLGDRDAQALLASATRGPLDPQIRDAIVAESHGNPLALLELYKGLSPAMLAGGFRLPEVWPLTGRIEQNFLTRVKALPLPTQKLLLTAAAEPVGDVPLLWRAAERLGIPPDAASPAQDVGLLELTSRVRFRHPLVRSAIYRAAAVSDRQAVHRALAAATDPDLDPDRRAWHRAQAAIGTDEDVAGELLRSADRARVRGGLAASAAFLERATNLTPDPTRRAARALATAQAKLDAADPDGAYACAAMAEIGPLDTLQHARLDRLRAEIAFAQRRGNDAPPLLLKAARILEPIDLEASRETYLQAYGATLSAGRIVTENTGAPEVAEHARNLPLPTLPARPVDLLLNGLTTRFTRGYVAALPILKNALEGYRREAHSEGEVRWLWVVCPVIPEPIAPDLWDDDTWHDLASSAVEIARSSGALTVLPLALTYRASAHVAAGEFSAAAALIDEANAVIESTGFALLNYSALFLAAWRGNTTEALARFRAARRDATARYEGRTIGLVNYATTLLYNGCGEYSRALAAAQRATEYEDVGIYSFALVELVEAAARSGRPEMAATAMRKIEERTTACKTQWALGTLARARALLSDDRAAESLYREAIERLSRTRITVHLARTHLVYGEWLRRQRRRTEARRQLHTAYDYFLQFGAEAFAERARRELAVTGETVARPHKGAHNQLTAQEEQVARLASEGYTNAEIGSRLFISPRTAEWHLRHVYSKLKISSRRELRQAFPA